MLLMHQVHRASESPAASQDSLYDAIPKCIRLQLLFYALQTGIHVLWWGLAAQLKSVYLYKIHWNTLQNTFKEKMYFNCTTKIYFKIVFTADSFASILRWPLRTKRIWTDKNTKWNKMPIFQCTQIHLKAVES